MTDFSRDKLLPTRVTFLELHQHTDFNVSMPTGSQVAIMRASNIPVHFYRYLYEKVGKPHHWFHRRVMTDTELKELIDNSKTLINVLYIDGCPAGFSEMSLFDAPTFVEISYFGLIPDYHGRGLANFFFSEILKTAWDQQADYIKIQTNTLDNPRALLLYQKFGFQPTDFYETAIPAWT